MEQTSGLEVGDPVLVLVLTLAREAGLIPCRALGGIPLLAATDTKEMEGTGTGVTPDCDCVCVGREGG